MSLVLFVRPPRPAWPMNGPDSSFWPPLAFASLAAALRDAIPVLPVGILDAPVQRMGWRTLESRLRELRPAWVGIGEEAVSCAEGLRVARLARSLGARVVAGGCFFGHVAPHVLRSGAVDVVVHGEGERTIADMFRALRDGGMPALRGVPGLSFRDGDDVVHGAPRALIENLDELPLPAWDLLPMELYGRRSRNHPALASIELSRGCSDACSFCILWRQMGSFSSGKPRPRLRAKSPERVVEEVRVLARRHGRRYLGWVDPCFNADPEIPRRAAQRLLTEGLVLGQSAWVRADALQRDAESGALKDLVAAGLNEVYVGIERPDDRGLRTLGKGESMDACRVALQGLAREHPGVFIVGSFIYGLPGDTPATVRAIHRLSHDLPLDLAFIIPLAPLPGTPFWDPALWDDSGEGFRSFSFLPSSGVGGSSPELDRELLRCIALAWSRQRFASCWRGLTGAGARKRRLTLRLLARTTLHAARLAWSSLRGRRDHGLSVPAWYEA